MIMTSVLNKRENNVATLTIEVSPEDFIEALQRSFRKNAGKFNVPGFRRGKAPLGIVTKYYGEGVLYDDAIDFAATPAYSAALAEYGLEPVDRPDMDIQAIGREVGIKFTVTVTIKPEVQLGQYRGVEAVMPEYPVTDDDVERELTRVRERNSRMIPIEDRAVQDGDTANIDYEGFVDEVAFEGGKGSSYDLKIGSNTFIPGFEEQMVGHNAGEEFDISVSFPEDYSSEDLKGKTARFHVKINAIKVRELPELDDEFAKDVSEFDTLAEYRDSIRVKQAESNQNRAKGVFEDNVIQAVVKNATVEIPAVMIDHEIEHMIEEQNSRMQYQGISLEQYLGYMGQTMDSFKEELRAPAETRVKTSLVLDAIIKAETFEVSDEEISQEFERMASQYGMKAEEVKERLGGNDGYVRENVIRQKAVTMLTEAAVKIAAPAAETAGETVSEAQGGTAKPAKKTAKKTTKKAPAKGAKADAAAEEKPADQEADQAAE
jgi:trigger factor